MMEILILIGILMPIQANINPFSDSVLYNINWPGPSSGTPPTQDKLDNLLDEKYMLVTTLNNEEYKCILPLTDDANQQEDIDAYKGPTELELLDPLIKKSSCSYRIESYWTYELCHGNFLRQYHEEKEPGKVAKIQEYFLGRYGEKEKSEKGATEEREIPVRSGKKRVQKVEGVEMPYFAMQYEDGTFCELTGRPRRVAVKYVCQPDGKGEIYLLKEVATCDYELVILTSLLCAHVAYQMKKDPVNHIRCRPLSGSPSRPRSLDNMELENTLLRYNSQSTSRSSMKIIVLNPSAEEGGQAGPPSGVTKEGKGPEKFGSGADRQLLRDFLNGDYCITGGSGWWKHEICFNKKVTQFHQDGNGRTSIMLGRWSLTDHQAWLQANPTRRQTPSKKTLPIFYGNGDVCDLTGKPREVEVRLKCITNEKQPQVIGIYLIERQICQYLLVVESPMFCSFIQDADENGIIHGNP